MENNKITIRGQEFYWEILYEDRLMYFDLVKTIFYKTTITIPEWTFLNWQSKKNKIKPIVLFSVDFDVRTEHLTKTELRNKIERAYEHSLRKEEIARGELI